MNKQEKCENVILYWFHKEKTHFTNRDFFYLINNDKSIRLEDQEECDNLLAKLILEHKIDPKRIDPDPGIFKPNKKLEKLIQK